MIKTNIGQFIDEIDNLRHLVRYQTAPRVSSESVAEHSFFVTAYVLKLHDYFKFDLEKALQMAVLHDFSEAYISDVPHPIKAKYKEISDALEQVEHDINIEHISEEFANNIEEFNNKTTAEGIIVSMADILSVISYSKYEVGLGNSKYMKDVFDRAIIRLSELIDKSNQYLKNEKTIKNFKDDLDAFIKF